MERECSDERAQTTVLNHTARPSTRGRIFSSQRSNRSNPDLTRFRTCSSTGIFYIFLRRRYHSRRTPHEHRCILTVQYSVSTAQTRWPPTLPRRWHNLLSIPSPTIILYMTNLQNCPNLARPTLVTAPRQSQDQSTTSEAPFLRKKKTKTAAKPTNLSRRQIATILMPSKIESMAT